MMWPFSLSTPIVLLIVFSIGALSGGSAAWKVQDWKFTSEINEMKLNAEVGHNLAVEAARKKEREDAKKAAELDKQHNILVDKNRRLNKRLDDLLRESGGVFHDPGYIPSSGVPSTCPTPGGASGTPSGGSGGVPESGGGVLSPQTSRFIANQAAKCDDVAAYAQTCYKWVTDQAKDK